MYCYKKAKSNHSTAEEAATGEKYACRLCGYETDMKHCHEWHGLCYQCYTAETKGAW
jgi:hypothetical protein